MSRANLVILFPEVVRFPEILVDLPDPYMLLFFLHVELAVGMEISNDTESFSLLIAPEEVLRLFSCPVCV